MEKYCRARQSILHAGCLRLQSHTQNMKYLLRFHCNNGYLNAPECYSIRTLSFYNEITARFSFNNCYELSV